MPRSRTPTEAGAADALFDRYTLPKVALGVILAASLAGTWVTAALSGHRGPTFVVGKWLYFLGLGVLTGGLVWKHAFVRPADLGSGAADYCAEMYDRFNRIAILALAAIVFGAPVVLTEYLSTFGRGPTVFVYGVSLITWTTAVMMTTRRGDAVERQFRSPVGMISLTLALVVVVATGVAEVALRGFDPIAAAVRVIHLLAFAVWIGGAVWNIFVAVPTGKKRPTAAVVRAAGEQLERFRWAVRVIIPTLLLTGLHQASSVLGTDVSTYLETDFGLVILTKVGFIGLLVVIFLLCPMWRACSPIDGVCELDDLDTGAPDADGGDDNRSATGGREVSVGD